MGNFEISVITVFAIACIISLIIISIILKNEKLPAVVADTCPDFWYSSYYDMDASNNIGGCDGTQYGCCPDKSTAMTDINGSNCPGPKCYNSHKLGNSSCENPKDFGTSDYTGSSGLCNKKSWATSCGLTWDGVTDVNMQC